MPQEYERIFPTTLADLTCDSFNTPTSWVHTPTDTARMSTPHHHSGYEIYLLIAGSARAFIENTCIDLTPGTVTAAKPYAPHRYVYFSNTPPNLRFVFNVHPRYLSAFYSESAVRSFFSPFEETCFVRLSEEETKKYIELAHELDAEFAKPDHGNSFLPIGDILSLLARHSEKSPAEKAAPSADPRIQRMIEYVSVHFAEPITLETLSREFYIGKRTINELFKRELGTTPGTFLTDLRVQNALFLLTRSDYTFRKISTLCGFSSPAHFYQAFTGRMKASPSAFRKQYREEVLSR